MPAKLPYSNQGDLMPGIYELSFQELQHCFGRQSVRRKQLCQKLELGLRNLKQAGIKTVYINGSFVTQKREPDDIDGCWDYRDDIDEERLDPVFLDFSQGRKAMKEKYGVDFFIANTIELGSGMPFVAFFQMTREGIEKGIVRLDLEKETFHALEEGDHP